MANGGTLTQALAGLRAGRHGWGRALRDWWLRRQFNARKRANFYEDMSRFIGAGLAPFQVIERITSLLKSKKKLRWKYQVMRGVLVAMRSGRSFSEAISRFIPEVEAGMLLAGESTGRLKEALAQMSDFTTRVSQLQAEIRRGVALLLTYVAVIYGIVIYIAQSILVAFTDFGTIRNQFASAYMGTVQTVDENKFLIPVLVGLVMAAVIISLKRWRPGAVREFLDHKLPPWNLYSRTQTAFALNAISVMMTSGFPLNEAVKVIIRHASPWAKSYYQRILKGLSEGLSETQAMIRSRMLHEDEEGRMVVYEVLNEPGAVMHAMARDSLEATKRNVTRLMAVVMIMVMALVAGFIAATMMAMALIAIDISSATNMMSS